MEILHLLLNCINISAVYFVIYYLGLILHIAESILIDYSSYTLIHHKQLPDMVRVHDWVGIGNIPICITNDTCMIDLFVFWIFESDFILAPTVKPEGWIFPSEVKWLCAAVYCTSKRFTLLDIKITNLTDFNLSHSFQAVYPWHNNNIIPWRSGAIWLFLPSLLYKSEQQWSNQMADLCFSRQYRCLSAAWYGKVVAACRSV